MWNLVGFQTRLRIPEQKRVFSMIPGLGAGRVPPLRQHPSEQLYQQPAYIGPRAHRQGRRRPLLRRTAHRGRGLHRVARNRTARGHQSGPATGGEAGRQSRRPRPCWVDCIAIFEEADPTHFQPMNANWGLVDPLDDSADWAARRHGKGRMQRSELLVERARAGLRTMAGDSVKRDQAQPGRSTAGVPSVRPPPRRPEVGAFLEHLEKERQVSPNTREGLPARPRRSSWSSSTGTTRATGPSGKRRPAGDPGLSRRDAAEGPGQALHGPGAIRGAEPVSVSAGASGTAKSPVSRGARRPASAANCRHTSIVTAPMRSSRRAETRAASDDPVAAPRPGDSRAVLLERPPAVGTRRAQSAAISTC